MLPTIRLIDGQLPHAVAETQRALKAAGTEVFSRAGSLVYPVGEAATTAERAGRRGCALSALQRPAQCVGRCRSAAPARAHGAVAGTEMDVPEGRRDHHHSDAARGWFAARHSRLRSPELSPNFGDGLAGQAAAVMG